MQELHFQNIPEHCLTLNTGEVAMRLRTHREYTDPRIQAAEDLLRKILNVRYVARRVPITFLEQEYLDLGFGPFHSQSLTRNLTGCSEAFLLAVTLGIEVDRLLLQLSHLSPGEHFICDGLASAFAEAACDYAESNLKGSLSCNPRFSPGYGDLPLEIQPDFLQFLDAGRLLGIHLGKTLLMTPMKSITAMIGIKHESERTYL